MACYIRLQEGDCLVESGEFAETQVQRPPEQHSSIPRVDGLIPPSPALGEGLGMRFVEAYVGAMSAGADFD